LLLPLLSTSYNSIILRVYFIWYMAKRLSFSRLRREYSQS
jgi:hypothetical protein